MGRGPVAFYTFTLQMKKVSHEEVMQLPLVGMEVDDLIHTWAAFILEHTVLNIQLGIPSAVKLFYNFQNVATHFLTIIPVLCVHIISNSFSSIMSVPSVWPYPWF